MCTCGKQILYFPPGVVVVYHVTIVAMDLGCLRNFGLLVIGCVLRTAGSLLFVTWFVSEPISPRR